MKIKRTRCQVPGARCQGAHLDSDVPAGGLATARSEKTTFQPGMYMKTKNTVRNPRSEVRSLGSKGLCGLCAYSDSWLLTSDSCASTNEGATGDVVENTRSGSRKTEHGMRGVQILASAFQGTLAAVERGAHASVTGYPGNMLKTRARQNPITNHKSLFANALAPYF